MFKIVVRAHSFEGPLRAVRSSANGGATEHVSSCAVCGAHATRMNRSRKAGKGAWIMNPGQPLLCIESDRPEPVVGPVAGPHGTPPAQVAA